MWGSCSQSLCTQPKFDIIHSMSKENPYPAPELRKGGTFYAHISLIDGYGKVVGGVESNEKFQAGLNAYAERVTEALGLKVSRLVIDERGLTNVSVVPGQCACIGIIGDSWRDRDKKLPEFSSHNVDTANQYVALTSIVFYYLNQLKGLINDKSA